MYYLKTSSHTTYNVLNSYWECKHSVCGWCVSVLLFQPLYWLGHPEKHLFLLSKKTSFWIEVCKTAFDLILKTEALVRVLSYLQMSMIAWECYASCFVNFTGNNFSGNNDTGNTCSGNIFTGNNHTGNFTPVPLVQPKYRSGRPDFFLFSLFRKVFSGSKNPKNILFYFAKRSTASHVTSYGKTADVNRPCMKIYQSTVLF